jgi:hypothetical protein
VEVTFHEKHFTDFYLDRKAATKGGSLAGSPRKRYSMAELEYLASDPEWGDFLCN